MKTLLRVLVLMILVGITSSPVVAQDLTAHTVLLWSFSGQFWLYNEATEEITEFYMYEPKLGQIDSVFAGAHELYFLESNGTPGFFIPGDSQIVRLNPETGTAEILFHQKNIYTFRISANERFAVIVSFAPDIEQTEWDSPQSVCVLTIEKGICQEVQLPPQPYRIVWADNEQFIVASFDASYLVDFASRTSEVLPFLVIDAVSAHTNQDFWVSIAPNPPEYPAILGRFNLISRDFQPYDLPPELSGIISLDLSPNDQYLTLGYGVEYKILDIETGAIVGTVEEAIDLWWLSDGENLIAGFFPQPGSYPQQIIKYDVTKQETTVIASFDEEVFIADDLLSSAKAGEER